MCTVLLFLKTEFKKLNSESFLEVFEEHELEKAETNLAFGRQKGMLK